MNRVWQAMASAADVVGQEGDLAAPNLLTVRDDHAFVWSSGQFAVLAARLTPGEEDPLQTFKLTETPLFDVEQILAGSSGHRLLLVGKRGLMVVELPRRLGKFGRFANGQKNVTCRSYGVADHFMATQHHLLVQHTAWHPSSLADSHVVVLTSDNFLRVYNLGSDSQIPEQSFSLTSAEANGGDTSNLFRESSMSVRGSLGETAIAFAFAPPVAEADEETSTLAATATWPVFILYGNGEIYCLLATMESSSSNAKFFGKNVLVRVILVYAVTLQVHWPCTRRPRTTTALTLAPFSACIRQYLAHPCWS